MNNGITLYRVRWEYLFGGDWHKGAITTDSREGSQRLYDQLKANRKQYRFIELTNSYWKFDKKGSEVK